MSLFYCALCEVPHQEGLATCPVENRRAWNLKPCPFCGGEAEVIREGTTRHSAQVGCTNCGCHVESNEIGAGYLWNMRIDMKTSEKSQDQES
jgi:hypothetical protein